MSALVPTALNFCGNNAGIEHRQCRNEYLQPSSASLSFISRARVTNWNQKKNDGDSNRYTGSKTWYGNKISTCRASRAGNEAGNSSPPQSREEAVQQASDSLSALLGKVLRAPEPLTIKKRKTLRQQRLLVDLPLLDDSPSALAELARDVLSGLIPNRRGQAGIFLFFSDQKSAGSAEEILAGSPLSAATYESFQPGQLDNAAAVAFVGPSESDVSAVERICASCGTRPAIALNPGWSPEETRTKEAQKTVTSFEACYCFLPLAIKGFFGTSEGAIFKYVRGGAPGGTPWLVLAKKGRTMECVSRLKRRPTSAELETALYASMAANSPVTKSMAFLQSVMPGGKQK